MTKIKKRIRLEVFDYRFFDGDKSMDLSYSFEGKEKEIHLTEEELLEALNESGIATIHGDRIYIEDFDDYFDPSSLYGHGQVDRSYHIELEEYMKKDFRYEEACDLLVHLEEQKKLTLLHP